MAISPKNHYWHHLKISYCFFVPMFSLGNAKTKNNIFKIFKMYLRCQKSHFNGFFHFAILPHKLNTQGNITGFTLKTSFGNEILIGRIV